MKIKLKCPKCNFEKIGEQRYEYWCPECLKGDMILMERSRLNGEIATLEVEGRADDRGRDTFK